MGRGKTYRSFDEIQRDLTILRLQREIAKESLKLNFVRVKKQFSPVQAFGNTSGILKSLALTFAVKTLRRLLQKNRSKKLLED